MSEKWIERKLAALGKELQGLLMTSMLWLFLSLNAFALEVTVGIDTLELPAPPGFEEISSLSTSARERAESMTPSINRLLAVYLSAEDADRLRRGQPAKWNRYMMIQTERRSETLSVSHTDFTELKLLLKRQQATLEDQVKAQTEQLTQAAGRVPVESGQTLPLGVFSESDAHISTASLASYEAASGAEAESLIVASGTNVLHPANKLVFAYVFASYQGEPDLAWTREVSDGWRQQILSANPSSTGASILAGGFDWDRVLSTLLMVAIIGGLAAFVIRRRMRAG